MPAREPLRDALFLCLRGFNRRGVVSVCGLSLGGSVVQLINRYSVRLDIWTRRYPLRVFFLMLSLGLLVCIVANAEFMRGGL